MRNLRLKIFLVGLLVWTGSLAALDFRIRVNDPLAKKNLADVQVIILETRSKYFTEENGEVAASVPDAGFYTFRVIVPGGGLVQPRIQILSDGQVAVVYTSEPPKKTSVAAEEEQIVGEEGIVVSGRKEKNRLSRYQVRLDEIKRIPGQFGEALRGLETLPGIITPPFGGGDIIIRGAPSDANIFLLDGLPMGYSFHILGFNSVLHNDMISTIDIFTGAYPANYGNATGGVIAIESVDEVEKFSGHTTFSLWSSNALFQAPFADGDGYWIGAGRISYLHKTIGNLLPAGIEVIPYYWDGQFKMHYRFNAQHSMYMYAFGAKDVLVASVDDQPTWDPTTEFSPIIRGVSAAIDQAFHTEAVRYIWQPASRLQNRVTALYTSNISHVDASIGAIDVAQKTENGYAALRDELEWEVLEDHIFLDLGLEGRIFEYRFNGQTVNQIDPNDESPDIYDTESPDFVTIPVHDSIRTSLNSAWAILTLQGGGVEFKPGVRADYFGLTKQRVIDPRATLSYSAPSKTTFTVGGGVYHRLPNQSEYSPSSGNSSLRMERAEHYGAGVEQELGRWVVKLEGFRHYFQDFVVTDPYIVTPIRENQHPYDRYDEPYLFNDRMFFSNDGSGFSEGWEFYIKRNKPEKENGWYGWISYTWSRALYNDHQYIPTDEDLNLITSADERRILFQVFDNTKDGYADYDRTVVGSLVLGYKVNREWQLGVKWQYQTATPFTPIIDDDSGSQSNNGRVIFDPVYSDLTNSRRLKPYHRMDVRIDRFIHYGWGYGNVFLELLNVYLRENQTAEQWNSGSPLSLSNPGVASDFGSLVVPLNNNDGLRVPLFNFGIELKF